MPLEKTPVIHNPQNPASGIQITVENLGKRFNREWIFRGLNYTFQPGNTYAITGPNGSGKSTLLQVLWAQMPPSTGMIQYHANNIAIPQEEIYKHLSIATPYMELIEELTLWEQVAFHFKLKAPRHGISIADLIDAMYLTPARDKYISNFSSGMRQRVKLALAFFSQTDIIFLDEPGTNLDKQAFHWYQHQLKTLPSSCLVFIASNNPAEYPPHAQTINIQAYKNNAHTHR